MKISRWLLRHSFSASLFISFFISCCLQTQKVLAAPSEPSSEIPERRDYPEDKNTNPCTDFHKYLCESAETHFKLREDRSFHLFAFSDSSERLLKKKMSFLKNIHSEKGLSARGQQIKNYYQACMNEKAGAQSERSAFTQFLKNLKELKTVSEFARFNLKNLQTGDPSLFSFWIEPNKDNPKVYDVSAFIQLMNLPEYSYYENQELMRDYRALVFEVLKLSEPRTSNEKLEQRTTALLNLERDFVKIFPHPEGLRQRWTEKRQSTQADFIAKYPNLELAEILKLTPQELFINSPVPEGFDFMQSQLRPETLQTFKDFLLFSMASHLLDDSNQKFYKKYFEFNKKYIGGPSTRSVRQERCTQTTMAAFNLEIDQILTPRVFPNFPAEKVQVLAKKIRESIIAGIQRNTWLSKASNQEAQRKIESARLFLVQPQNEREWDFLPIQKYSSTNKVQNFNLLRKASFEKSLADLKQETNLVAWGMGPLTVNAYYDASANKFVLPIGILQYPFFDSEASLIENLGAIGAIFAHELGHGIDDQGAKYDADGKLRQWMNIKEVAEFGRRGQILVEQFNKAGHNGRLTLGENIADFVGLSFAYQAAFPKGEGSQEDQQKFFKAYGRLWCFVGRPKTIENILKTNPHALGSARINEQVKQQPAFAKAFQCKPGDAMTLPENERVKIW